MEPFTDYAVFRAFCYRADGDFSYLWYALRFTETVEFNLGWYVRQWRCNSLERRG